MRLTHLVKKMVGLFGFEISRRQTEERFAPDVDPAIARIYQKVRPFTMTSPERIFSLCEAVKYICDKQIEGEVVECGVWRGGSMMAIAETLLQAGDTGRDLYLFDTFEGLPPPTKNDVDFTGIAAETLMEQLDTKEDGGKWCRATLDDVKTALGSTGYPIEKTHFVKGMVEQTIPHSALNKIAILRLDTDWYESTKHEMEHLFPMLSKGGVLIIDDYGHWQGARKAVDEYIEKKKIKILLNRIDYTGRIAVKIE